LTTTSSPEPLTIF